MIEKETTEKIVDDWTTGEHKLKGKVWVSSDSLKKTIEKLSKWDKKCHKTFISSYELNDELFGGG